MRLARTSPAASPDEILLAFERRLPAWPTIPQVLCALWPKDAEVLDFVWERQATDRWACDPIRTSSTTPESTLR